VSKTMSRRNTRFEWIFLVFAVLSVPASSAQELDEPIRQITYREAFKPGNSMPKWEQGYLVSWKYDTSASDSAENVTLYDRDGNAIAKTRIWLSDASFVRIEDATTRKDGEVAVVGWATTNSGTLAAFMADVSTARNSVQIMRTSPFEGRAVGFGPDGTIWVLGRELGPGRGKEPAPDHFMVQHFGLDDVLRDQHLLSSDFPCELARQINGTPRVVASSDRVGFFAPFCRMWVELSPTGEMLGQWSWKPLSPITNGVESQAGVRSVALTPANELYGWTGWNAYSLVRFDRHSSRWLPVQTDSLRNTGAPFWALYGIDGDTLVYHTSENRLAWTKPRKLE